MASFTIGDYGIVSCDPVGVLRGIRVRARAGRLQLLQTASVPPEKGDLLGRLEKLGKNLGISRGMYLYLSGDFPDGGYFECVTAALPRRELADSLTFAAQQHLPKVPDNCRIEFVSIPAEPGMVRVHAYALPSAALEPWIEALTALKWRPDGWVYPLLALPELPADAAVLLPELGEGFFRRNHAWFPADPLPATCNRELKNWVATHFPDGAVADEFLTCAVVAIRVAQRDFAALRPGVEVFPKALKPRRFRNQLRFAATLAALWCALGVWCAGEAVFAYASKRSALIAEIDGFTEKSRELDRKIKSAEKNQKEYTRVLELANGDRMFLPRLALLSGVLPSDVLLSNLRASESAWELTLLTEAEEIDLGPVLRRMPGFKLTGLQQRSMGNSLLSITAKLTAAEERKGGKP